MSASHEPARRKLAFRTFGWEYDVTSSRTDSALHACVERRVLAGACRQAQERAPGQRTCLTGARYPIALLKELEIRERVRAEPAVDPLARDGASEQSLHPEDHVAGVAVAQNGDGGCGSGPGRV